MGMEIGTGYKARRAYDCIMVSSSLVSSLELTAHTGMCCVKMER